MASALDLVEARMADIHERWEAAIAAGNDPLAAALFDESGALLAIARDVAEEAQMRRLDEQYRELRRRDRALP
jgi:hypothetical protein